MTLPTLTNIERLRGGRILLRVDFNMPIVDGVVSDDFRLLRTVPTILKLRAAGLRIVLISHRGEKEDSLELIARLFVKKTGIPVSFASSLKDLTEFEKVSKPGDVMFLENLRRFSGETENDESFARQLAQHGDVYMNEAFSASHRSHASIVGVPRFLDHVAGWLFADEVKNLSKAFSPKRPAVFILGGSKVETKLPLIIKFLSLYDSVFVGGAVANDIFSAQGIPMGKSFVSQTVPDISVLLQNKKLVLPEDVVVNGPFGVLSKSVHDIMSDEIAVDVGPKTINTIRALLAHAKSVLWNGPLGVYEKGYIHGTESVAKIVASSKAFSIIGGGDTAAVIRDRGLERDFGFLSTGGGATLDFLANGTLPGIEALLK